MNGEKFEKISKKEKFKSLKTKAAIEGRIPIIVQLDTSFEPVGKLKSTFNKLQRDNIHKDQDSLLNFMSAYNPKNVHKFKHIPFVAMSVDKKSLDRLESSPFVVSISEDIITYPLLEYSIPLIGADNAWNDGFSGQGQAVAILDTGVNYTHPFLSGKVVGEGCYSGGGITAWSLCPNGLLIDETPGSGANCDPSLSACDHGTHVAGIAVGNGVNSGVAKDADLIAIQVFTNHPVFGRVAYTSDIIKGLERVLTLSGTQNISSVNLSLGGGPNTSVCDSGNTATKDAVDNLRSVGIATVAASGNGGSSTGISYPACISSVISVGSTEVNSPTFPRVDDTVSSFSNSASFLDLLAPGEVILSSIPGTGFGYKQGTSMAAPHVAGAWACVKIQ